MKSKEIASFLLLALLLPLISAQFFGSPGFSPADFLSSIDPQTIFIFVAFGVFLALLKTILDRYAAFQGSAGNVISILLSLAMTYGINKWLSFNDLLFNIGYSGDALPYLLLALLILLIFFLFKYRCKTFVVSGSILVILSLFTEFFAEKETILITGIILFLMGAVWCWMGRERKPRTPQGQIVYQQRQRSLYDLKQKLNSYKFEYNSSRNNPQRQKRIKQAMAIIEKEIKRLS